MIFEFNSTLQPSALYETSFHLPVECTKEGLEAFLKKHAEMMPGLLPTGPLVKMAKSKEYPGCNHFMVLYPFESIEKAREYIDTPSISAPVREAFSAAYGAVANGRTRYLQGEKL